MSHSAFTGGAAYIDDQFVPVSEARIPILGLGLLHSDATYDVVHVWQGCFSGSMTISIAFCAA